MHEHIAKILLDPAAVLRLDHDIPGIYAIVKRSTGEAYIGSSLNMKARMTGHLNKLREVKHQCARLQFSWDQDSDDFVFFVLEKCDESDLTTREQYWIDQLKPNIFNSTWTATRPIIELVKKGLAEMSDESKETWKQKLSETSAGREKSEEETQAIVEGVKAWHAGMSDEDRALKNQKIKDKRAEQVMEPCSDEKKKKISAGNKAAYARRRELGLERNLSAESREAMAAASRGKPKSDETKAKMAEARRTWHARRKAASAKQPTEPI